MNKIKDFLLKPPVFIIGGSFVVACMERVFGVQTQVEIVPLLVVKTLNMLWGAALMYFTLWSRRRLN